MTRPRGWALRKLLSHTPSTGLVPHPSRRPQGITAVVRVKNEAEWIEPCLVSVSDAVDELVVVDNGSTDRTLDILARLRGPLGPKLRLFSRPDLDHVDLSNFAMAQATYRWALKWDGDFVAHTSGPHAITRLRERILGLPSHRYVHVYLTCVEVVGDLWHQRPGWELRHDPFVCAVSPSLRFVRVVRTLPPAALHSCGSVLRDPRVPVTTRFEDVRVPLYYDVEQWSEPYFFHVQVKNPRRMYLRDCWADWAENPELQARFASLDDYGLHRARRSWNVETLHEASLRYMAGVRDQLVPYSVERFGTHPDILKPYLEAPEVVT